MKTETYTTTGLTRGRIVRALACGAALAAIGLGVALGVGGTAGAVAASAGPDLTQVSASGMYDQKDLALATELGEARFYVAPSTYPGRVCFIVSAPVGGLRFENVGCDTTTAVAEHGIVAGQPGPDGRTLYGVLVPSGYTVAQAGDQRLAVVKGVAAFLAEPGVSQVVVTGPAGSLTVPLTG